MAKSAQITRRIAKNPQKRCFLRDSSLSALRDKGINPELQKMALISKRIPKPIKNRSWQSGGAFVAKRGGSKVIYLPERYRAGNRACVLERYQSQIGGKQ